MTCFRMLGQPQINDFMDSLLGHTHPTDSALLCRSSNNSLLLASSHVARMLDQVSTERSDQ